MKKIKYIITFIITLLVTHIAYSNPFKDGKAYLNFNSDLIEGVWVAVDGDMTYTLTIVRTFIELVLPNSEVFYLETLLGAVKYKKGEEVIRNTAFGGLGSFLHLNRESMMRDNSWHYAYFSLTDSERKICGYVKFNLDLDDLKTARWSLSISNIWQSILGWTEDTFDIPLELEFKQIQGVPPRRGKDEFVPAPIFNPRYNRAKN